VYDAYRGTLVYFRVVDGELKPGDRIRLLATGFEGEIDDLAVHSPEETPIDALGPGEVGVLSAAIKEVSQAKVGDTITLPARAGRRPRAARLPRAAADGVLRAVPDRLRRLPDLRDALDKLRLNDASFSFEPETSAALGFGFRCGFLGLLHLEIITERLDREFGIPLVTTAPSVRYRVTLEGQTTTTRQPDGPEVSNPQDLPRAQPDRRHRGTDGQGDDPDPDEYVGAGHAAVRGPPRDHAGDGLPHRGARRAALRAAARRIITDFFDQLKSMTRGYASLDYERGDYVAADLVGRRAAQRRAGRRLQLHRAPRRGLRVRQGRWSRSSRS
jgi:GTP-binding protein LepA